MTTSQVEEVLHYLVDLQSLAMLAGTVSTVLFAVSTLPMLIKAARTKELSSYSRGNLVLANIGNAVHSIYVFQLPPGPIWALHTFYLITSGLMLFWHLRYARRSRPLQPVPTSWHSDPLRQGFAKVATTMPENADLHDNNKQTHQQRVTC